MKINLDQLSETELIELKHKIVERLYLIHRKLVTVITDNERQVIE